MKCTEQRFTFEDSTVVTWSPSLADIKGTYWVVIEIANEGGDTLFVNEEPTAQLSWAIAEDVIKSRKKA